MPTALKRTCYLVVLLSVGNTARAQNPDALGWPQWRGPQGTGVSLERGWNAHFEESGPKKLWEAKVGRGFSSPIVQGGALFLFSTDPANLQRESLARLDAETGAVLWQHTYEIASVKRSGNPAGGTPALVGNRVFTYGAGLNLGCVDARSGQPLWSRDLMKDLPGRPCPYGYQLSPTPYENLIIVPAILGLKPKGGGPAFEPRAGPYPVTGGVLLAFDQQTGKEIWRNTEGASAWSSPVLADFAGLKTLVHLTGRYLLGINPRDGKTRWKFDLRDVGFDAEDMAASPAIAGDVIVVPIHKAYGSVAAGTAGSAGFRVQNGKPQFLWKNTQWCHWFQSPAIWGDAVYAFDEKSTFWSLDLRTGKERWRTKELGVTNNSGGGFVIADGKLIAIDARRHLTIAELGPTGPKILSKAVIFSGAGGFECETAPLLLDGRLYCRNHTQLVCFDLRAAK